MTFRSIGNFVSKKKNFVIKKENKESTLRDCINRFLKNEYSDYVLEKTKINLYYELKEDRLIIETNTKIFANDLVLKLAKLTEFLLKNSCKVNQIVIK